MSDRHATFNLVKAISKSDVVFSVLLFILFDIVFRFALSVTHQTLELGFDVPYRSRIWYATEDFLSLKSKPDVILLGASDLACALYRAEATFLGSPQSQILKHKSEYFASALKAAGSPYYDNFCLAIPGEMPSDTYFLVRTLLAGSFKPKTIFLSITPRSFCDATFGDPSSTDIFKVMSKLQGTRGFDFNTRTSLWDKLDFGMGTVSSIYGHKWELMSWQHHVIHTLLGKFMPENFDSIRTPCAIRKLALLELPEDYGPNELMETPYDPKHPMFLTNIDEYRARYRQFKQNTFKQQMEFMERLCQLCRAQGTNLIVGNSPLTAENRELVSKTAHDLYIDTTKQVLSKYGHTFVDFDLPGAYQHDDFYDTIHLNGKGGEKFLQQVAVVIGRPSAIAASGNLRRSY